MPVIGRRRQWRAAVQQMVTIGADALPMAAVLSFCIGYVLALQSATELRRFSALHFVVDLVHKGTVCADHGAGSERADGVGDCGGSRHDGCN